MADSCDSVEFAKQSSFFFVRNPETTEINSPEENGNIATRTEDDLKPDDQFDSIPRWLFFYHIVKCCPRREMFGHEKQKSNLSVAGSWASK